MALGGAHAPGATPLDPDELTGLIPGHISTQGELNEWEQSNIVQGQEWALRSTKSSFPSMLTDHYAKLLHKKMFDQHGKILEEVKKVVEQLSTKTAIHSVQIKNLEGKK